MPPESNPLAIDVPGVRGTHVPLTTVTRLLGPL